MESGVLKGGLIGTNVEYAYHWFADVDSAVNCDTAANVLACLRAVPADTLVLTRANSFDTGWVNIEPIVLPEDPFIKLQRLGSPVPLLIGAAHRRTPPTRAPNRKSRERARRPAQYSKGNTARMAVPLRPSSTSGRNCGKRDGPIHPRRDQVPEAGRYLSPHARSQTVFHSHARETGIDRRGTIEGKLRTEPGRATLMQARKAVERGWRAVSEIAAREGRSDVIDRIERFVAAMPPPQTEREQIASQLRAGCSATAFRLLRQ